LYAGGWSGLYRTSNEGVCWEETNPSGADTCIYDIIVFHDMLFVATESALFRTADYCNSWTICNNGLAGNQIIGFAPLGDRLYLATSSMRVFFTEDDGDNWTEASSGLPASGYMRDIVSWNGYLFLSLGTEGVYMSADSGTSWVESNDGLNVLYTKQLYCDDTSLSAGAYSSIWRTSLPAITDVYSPAHKPNFRVCPNPVHDKLTIQSERWMDNNFSLNDILGREILSIRFAGQSHTIELPTLEKGIYFLKRKDLKSAVLIIVE
jgi:photosystem II stability/assembly factor-like uncharacterized protein